MNCSGAVRDMKRNPVYNLLPHYKDMQEGEIICHINSWWFDVNCRHMFEEARRAGLIEKTGNVGGWKLTEMKP